MRSLALALAHLRLVLGLVVLAALSASGAASSSSCCFDVNADLPKSKVPLFLQGKELLLPEPSGKTGMLCVDSGEVITLACPGSKNQVSVSKTVTADATCVKNTNVKVGSKTSALSTLECSKAPSSTIRVTEDTCEKSGTVLKIGFEVSEQFHEMVSVCHQVDVGNTLYSKHTILKNIDAAVVESKRPAFTCGDKALCKGYKPDTAYKQSSQKVSLTKDLGADKMEELMGISFLARGHLAPDADFTYGSWQWSTYYYANAVPQWQSFNAGNWLAYEKLCRRLASKMNSDLNVITGSYGILTLPNAAGEPTQLYLDSDNQKVPIPEYMWKIVQDSASKKAIAIVGSNNILLDNTSKTLCDNICEANGWTTLTDTKKGFMYCCTVEDLRKVVDFIPEIEVSGILQGPK